MTNSGPGLAPGAGKEKEMMPKILICYATRYGQTEKIAGVLARELEALGHPVDLYDVERISPKIRVASYEGVIAGAPVYRSTFPRVFRQWVRGHAKSISARPSAFFSVCLGLSRYEEANRRLDEEEIVDRFLNLSDWEPSKKAIFNGAFEFSKYGWLTRKLMQRFARKVGIADDHDRELTDWNQVRALAEEFSSLLLERWPEASREIRRSGETERRT